MLQVKIEDRQGVMEPNVDYGDSEKVATNGTDTIKLFVGQIPRTWEESQLRTILEPFGAIQELTVLHERNSGLHKGSHCKETYPLRLRTRAYA